MAHPLNRRNILKSVPLAAGGAVLDGIGTESRTVSGGVPWSPGDANKPDVPIGNDYQFLSADEAAFLDAAAARLIPAPSCNRRMLRP